MLRRSKRSKNEVVTPTEEEGADTTAYKVGNCIVELIH
jgi:hypothetical protein